jgi:uncharacterized protein
MRLYGKLLRATLAASLLLVVAGPGVAGPFDDAQAAFWAADKAEDYRLTRLAAEQGNAKAQYLLGLFYFDGQGVAQSYTEAAKWFRRAAEQGNDEAQFELAGAYFFGFGVPQDYIEAHKWANLAVSRGAEEITRQSHFTMLETIAERLTPEQIVEAQKLAREWKPKSEQ